MFFFKLEYISGSCCWKVKVDYSKKNDVYTQLSNIYGYYYKQSYYINGKSYYKKGSKAIWYRYGTGWMIGKHSARGSVRGYAYNTNNYNCPYTAGFDWEYYNHYTNKLAIAGRGLSIYNKC